MLHARDDGHFYLLSHSICPVDERGCRARDRTIPAVGKVSPTAFLRTESDAMAVFLKTIAFPKTIILEVM